MDSLFILSKKLSQEVRRAPFITVAQYVQKLQCCLRQNHRSHFENKRQSMYMYVATALFLQNIAVKM